MSALTRDEAERRAASVAVRSYVIDLDLPERDEVFTSTTTVRFTAREPATFLELSAEELLQVTLDGAPVDPDWTDGRIALDGLGGEHELVVRARVRYSTDGEGLHRFVDPADDAVYLCATSSVDNARRWFACFDQPDLKASIELHVRCPEHWTVVANGAARRTGPGRWSCAPTPAVSTYLVTLVAGTWHSVTGEHDGIPLGLHVRASLAAELDRDAADLLQLTADALDAFHELFEVRYPFGEYHQAFVPEFNWGAMENPGCVTFRDLMIFRSRPTDTEVVGRATTIVHEMAHMWFGDLVTMRWWDDLWLNESFAEYLSHRVTAQITDMPAWEDFAAGRKGWGYDADRHASTHPIAGNGAPDAQSALADFDGISYAKGAAVLRQLAGYLGEEMFLGGLRAHVRDNAYGNATFADLLASWSAHVGPGTPSADDLARWAREWLRSAGVDTLTVGVANGTATITRGDPLNGPAADRPHAITVTGLPSSGSRTAVVVEREPVSLEVDGVVLPSAGDETWATVRLDPAQWAMLPDVLPATGDPVARVVVWNALRTGVEDGLVAPGLAARIVAAGLPVETDVVTSRVLRWAATALPRFLAPGPARDAALAEVAGAVARLLESAPAGSSLQLTAARGWIWFTDEPATLRDWVPGATPRDGLAVDAELGWTVLARRAALGDLSPEDIDAAYAADRTGSGLVHAERCRALRPDPAAKAEAWAALLDTATTRSQYQLLALAEGLWVPGQEEICAPYGERWFTDIPDTVAFRSGWALTRVAESCFPWLAVEPATLEAAGRFAGRTDLPTGLRRVAADGADTLRRALAVR